MLAIDPGMSTTDYQATRREITFGVPYDRFTRALESLLGRMDLGILSSIKSPEAMRKALASAVGPLDFALFQKIDHGGLLTVLAQRPTRAATYVFGNALIAVEMTRHDPRVGLYVPLRLFLQGSGDSQVIVMWDLPSALLAQFSPAIREVARTLDGKVERLVDESFRLASRGNH